GQSVTAAKFETFAETWLKDYAEITVKRTTMCVYRELIKRIYPVIGHIRIDKISPLNIQKLVQTLSNEGMSPRTIKTYVRFVSGILNYAIKKRLITYNPCTTVDFPKERPKEQLTHEIYSIEEVKQLLELLKQEDNEKYPFYVYFVLAVYMGARKGELLGLEWKDIDFDNDMISINRAYYYSYLEREYYTDTPKTATSRRSLKLPVHVMETLRSLQVWQEKYRELCGGSWVDNDRLFTTYNGDVMATTAPRDYFQRFCKRNGIRYIKPHAFRHFNASILINSGVDIVTVQAALGHSTPITTLRVYSHAFNNAKTRAMEAIANAIDI
ncbi:MAG: site-specific integrase, partial [Defluviitaleaceae bacterium]|nr:site-specific integrase [Defluviitaleaceae bacterium]